LQRFHQTGQLHFVTFSCYRRAALLNTPEARAAFERSLELVRKWYGLFVTGYVVMPEHVHLLVSEPKRANLAVALQMLKQIVARKVGANTGQPFWQRRYYDYNLWSEPKRIEKLRYMHRNPVKRGLVEKPEEWRWSSFRHYAFREEGTVEIASEWTARKKELEHH
jgi:putative transposase